MGGSLLLQTISTPPLEQMVDAPVPRTNDHRTVRDDLHWLRLASEAPLRVLDGPLDHRSNDELCNDELWQKGICLRIRGSSCRISSNVASHTTGKLEKSKFIPHSWLRGTVGPKPSISHNCSLRGAVSVRPRPLGGSAGNLTGLGSGAPLSAGRGVDGGLPARPSLLGGGPSSGTGWWLAPSTSGGFPGRWRPRLGARGYSRSSLFLPVGNLHLVGPNAATLGCRHIVVGHPVNVSSSWHLA